MSEAIESELHDLEKSLRGLKPVAAPLHRDELLFEAGRASMLARFRFWRRMTGWCAGLAVCMLLVSISVYSRQQPVRIVHAPAPQPVRVFVPDQMLPAPQAPAPLLADNPEAQAPPPGSYWQIQQQILRTGEMPAPTDHGEPDPRLPVRAPAIPTAWSVHSSSPLMQSRFAEGDFE